MPSQAYCNEGSLVIAGIVSAGILTPKVRLFTSGFVPGVSSKLADFVAAEADYTGYVAGGIAAVFGADYYAAGGGAGFNSQLIQFNSAAPVGPAVPVTNAISGFWIDNGTKCIMYAIFDSVVSMGQVGQSLPVIVNFVFGT